jgi:hypothetical protein
MVADPYLAAADRHLDEAAIVALLRPPDSPVEPAPTPTAAVPTAESVRPSDGHGRTEADGARRTSGADSGGLGIDEGLEAEAIASALLTEAGEPVNLAHIGGIIHRELGGDAVRRTKWFGSGSIRSFLLGRFPEMRSEGDLIWDPDRHPTPVQTSSPSPPSAMVAPGDLPPRIAAVASAAGMPRISSSTWPAVFEVLGQHRSTGSFSLSESTAWCRDELTARGFGVSRTTVNFVVLGCGFGGARLDADPPATREQLREAFTVSVLDRAGAAGLTVTREDEAALRSWLAGEG